MTSEGPARKEREADRREEELAAALRADDAKVQAEKDVTEKAARDAATSASSSSAISCGKLPQVEPNSAASRSAGSTRAVDIPVPSTLEPVQARMLCAAFARRWRSKVKEDGARHTHEKDGV